MPKEKTGLCEETNPHDPHDVWVSSALWPVDPDAEPTLLHCPGIPLPPVEPLKDLESYE